MLEFDIQYEPRGSIKGQVYADFVAELSPGGEQEVEAGSQWLLSVDGSSNQQGSGAGIVLEGPNGVLIEQGLCFACKVRPIKDPQMAAYLRHVQLLKRAFSALELIHVPREQNARADESQVKEVFINEGRGNSPSHLKFFLLVFSKLKEDIK